ncbi:MAG: DegT/DnrJ/EryC1/StrS family aminotransferase, partial [Chloroflexi bacterium]|nr:DegT/DnrJ/EryC1/StrS family aminotransferase [Chloroflexota bacterium]
NKQITTGEGGVIVTDDDQAADFMRAVGDTWLQHTCLGYNYRLDEMSAALGALQMTRLDELLKKREQVAAWYTERLAEIPGVETQYVEPFTTRLSWFVYVTRFEIHVDRDALASSLEARGVPVHPYFAPIHLQPYMVVAASAMLCGAATMVERFGYRPGDFPISEDLGRRGLALPFSGVMSEAQVEHVCQRLREALRAG